MTIALPKTIICTRFSSLRPPFSAIRAPISSICRPKSEYKKTAHLLPDTLLVLSLKCRVLHLDLNLNTAGELELHQRVDSLSGRAIDVNQTLVV